MKEGYTLHHIHTRAGLDVLTKMLPAQDAAGTRSWEQERCPGVLQEEGKDARI